MFSFSLRVLSYHISTVQYLPSGRRVSKIVIAHSIGIPSSSRNTYRTKQRHIRCKSLYHHKISSRTVCRSFHYQRCSRATSIPRMSEAHWPATWVHQSNTNDQQYVCDYLIYVGDAHSSSFLFHLQKWLLGIDGHHCKYPGMLSLPPYLSPVLTNVDLETDVEDPSVSFSPSYLQNSHCDPTTTRNSKMKSNRSIRNYVH